ncbi:hypothetical protein SO802_026863 [Lithocarpus litseifolius]|uniref:RNase H type-1 domain-containing protein n=1 Tax=Lithocarpus litseifolius TaxID=425828 RepID=A0AAW2C2Y1_9ROSI
MIFRNANNQRCLKTEILSRAIEFAYTDINGKQACSRAIIQVRWISPPINWYKLNSNGSFLENPRLAGGGGLIRDDKGDWIKGYARAIGITTNVAAESWALRDGIRLCIALKIPVVIIELDAQVVVDLLKKNASHPSGIGALVSDYKNGLKEISMVQIQHCYQEAKKCADTLARRGALLSQDFVIFLDPPTDVLFLLSLDVAGVYSDRFVSVA